MVPDCQTLVNFPPYASTARFVQILRADGAEIKNKNSGKRPGRCLARCNPPCSFCPLLQKTRNGNDRQMGKNKHSRLPETPSVDPDPQHFSTNRAERGWAAQAPGCSAFFLINSFLVRLSILGSMPSKGPLTAESCG